MMPFNKTHIPGLLVFEPKVFQDERGYFFESYNQEVFENEGITTDFVQDNQSRSKFGVLRGLHYQKPPFAQTKLVRVIQGEVLDVAVDIRRGSPTYGEHYAAILSEQNFKQLYIPKGFAHGFAVLSNEVVLAYKCDDFYSKDHDAGIMYNDPKLGIDWQLREEDIILSQKDQHLPSLAEAPGEFNYEN